MKKPILLLAFLLASWISFGQGVSPAPEDKAVVYFARPSSLGFAINFSYFDSTKLIGRFSGTKYIRYECDPGRHLFWGRSENRDFIEAEVEAGKIYFIEAIPAMGALKAAIQLEPIDPNDSKKMEKILKLINKKASVSFTEAELEADKKELGDVIERGLEQYKEDREKGKHVPLKLDKSMYYKG